MPLFADSADACPNAGGKQTKCQKSGWEFSLLAGHPAIKTKIPFKNPNLFPGVDVDRHAIPPIRRVVPRRVRSRHGRSKLILWRIIQKLPRWMQRKTSSGFRSLSVKKVRQP